MGARYSAQAAGGARRARRRHRHRAGRALNAQPRRAWVSVGSNVDAGRNLALACGELKRRFGALTLSPVYRNPAWGFDGDDFLNLVAGFGTTLSPAGVVAELEAIHVLAGRRRTETGFSPRTLDLDLLLLGDTVLDEGPVRLPRADILKYAFVLKPLADVAPSLPHPLTGRTMAEHWEAFDAGAHELTLVDVEL